MTVSLDLKPDFLVVRVNNLRAWVHGSNLSWTIVMYWLATLEVELSFHLSSELVKSSCSPKRCEWLRTELLYSKMQQWWIFDGFKLQICKHKNYSSGKLSENTVKLEMQCSASYACKICQFQRWSKKMQRRYLWVLDRTGPFSSVKMSDVEHETKERIQITMRQIVSVPKQDQRKQYILLESFRSGSWIKRIFFK